MTIEFNHFDEAVLEQAECWVARLRSDQVSDQDKHDFAQWLAESDRHKAAFDEIVLLWKGMDIVNAVDAAQDDGSPSALTATLASANDIRAANDEADSLNAAARVSETSANQKRTRKFPRLTENWLTAIAAGVAVIAVLLLYNFQDRLVVKSVHHFSYQTRIGEQRTVELPDGSVVELNTNSQLAVDYDQTQRHLTLARGEAYFEVAHNPDVPFVVDAGAGKITAVGTAFNVYREGRNTVVTVSEGKVSVVDKLNLASNSRIGQYVAAGQSILVDASTGLAAVSEANVDESLAWRKQVLIFHDTQLTQVLAELNRYLVEPVDFSHPSLESLKVSGTFSVSDPETTLTAIIGSFSLKMENDPETSQIKLLAPPL